MALSCALSFVGPASGAVASQRAVYALAITNTNAAAVTLNSAQVFESTESDAQISQPNILTPNVPAGVGNPVLLPGTTATYNFSVIFNSPWGGPSPQNQPGGAQPGNNASTPDAVYTLTAICNTSDGSVFSVSLLCPVLSTLAPFPLAQGGALQLSQGANIINGLTLGLV